ncbi:DUF7448 domain-containing protein [Enterococcus sp. LJL128]
MYDVNYGDFDELKKMLLYKKIESWTEDELLLDDGTRITIEMSASDCCANAGGKFTNVKLEAVITEVIRLDKGKNVYNGDGHTSRAEIVLFHNQNVVAQADCFADDGNGGYYFSVCSLVVKDIHFRVCEA